jgi:LAO/AO transport system kinase
MDGLGSLASLIDGLRARDRGSIARALNLLEDRRPSEREAQRALVRASCAMARGRVFGVTGPPGAGKSTLCSVLVRAFRARELRVGVVAVDPSSVKSGGALLGDRLRILTHEGRGGVDEGVFVRSLAAGAALGGLSRTAPSCVDLLAATSDVVLVETVGVGQSEVDVARVADLTLVAVQPASGDALQFLKAGILEIPDVLVVTKADLGDPARRAVSDLRHALAVARESGVSLTGARTAADAVAVCAVSSETGEGLDELVATLDRRWDALEESGALALRRFEGGIALAFETVARRVGELGIDALGGERIARMRLRGLLSMDVPAAEAAESVIDEAILAIHATRD